MSWQNYPLFAFLTLGFWAAGLIVKFLLPKSMKLLAELLILLGMVSIIFFTINLWISLERPPFRTLAETRLWYCLFTSTIGIIIYYRWKYDWMLLYSLAISGLFLIINYMKPDTFDKTLMPALQSPWFIPHVVVYIIGYAILIASSLTGLKGLYQIYKAKDSTRTIWLADNLVYMGFAFLTFGLLFGALWAKEAWGHYWTWDPKETWAFLTWLIYLLYIHLRIHHKTNLKFSFWVLSLAFIILLICWFGINYLPSAQNSVHVYSNR